MSEFGARCALRDIEELLANYLRWGNEQRINAALGRARRALNAGNLSTDGKVADLEYREAAE